jgi:hypothetical protein
MKAFYFAAVQNSFFLLKSSPKGAAVKPEGQIQFGTLIRRTNDNIEINLPEIRRCCGLV